MRKILVLAILVASAFLLIYLVDSAILVSRLGVNKPTPASFAWTIIYGVALVALQILCGQLLRTNRGMESSWLDRASLRTRVALAFAITSVLSAVIFFRWMVREL